MAQTSELTFLNTLLPLAGTVFIIALGVILLNQHFQKNLFRQRFQNEELKNNIQYNLFRASIEAQEVERKRIASNLHEEIGAVLSITRMHIVNMEPRFSGTDQASLQSLRELVEAALNSMRRISHELMPPLLESFGLIHTLKSVGTQLARTNAIQVELSTSDEHRRWSASVELGLYRICMELINNTLRHADAARIKIEIEELGGMIYFRYHDNGKGLPPGGITEGLGLKNILARVATLNGTVHWEKTEQTSGFNAAIVLPVVQ